VGSGVELITESSMVNLTHGFIGNAFHKDCGVVARGDRWKLEGRLNAHIRPFENDQSMASLSSWLPSVAYIGGIHGRTERLAKHTGRLGSRHREQFGGVHGGLVSRVDVLNLKLWPATFPTVRGEHFCFYGGNPSALFQLHGLVSSVSGVRGSVSSALALKKNEKGGSKIKSRNDAREAQPEHRSIFVSSGGLFIGVVLTSFGVVLLNRVLAIKYLDGAPNFNLITFFVVVVWLVTAFGFMLVLHFASEII
jgi:hypothetical protein